MCNALRILTVKYDRCDLQVSAPKQLNMTHLIDPEGGFTLLLLSPGLLAVHVRPEQLHTASDGRNMFGDVTG